MNETQENRTPQATLEAGATQTPEIVERNVRAMVDHAAEQERAQGIEERIASAISKSVGTMYFVYFHVVVYGLWTLEGLGWLPGIHGYDTSLSVLGAVASIEAIFIATFVLIAQNQMAKQAAVRNQLDVQMSLLTEQETTSILRIVAAMSEKMGMDVAAKPEVRELLHDVAPQDVLDTIEEHTEAAEAESSRKFDISPD